METRICKECGLEKPAIKGSWKMKHGSPAGRLCQICRLAAQRALRATPEGRRQTNLASQRYYAKNGARQRFGAAKTMQHSGRQTKAQRAWWAALIQATPLWLTDADWDLMDAIYAESYKQGRLASVDHIVPLVGKDLAGNHIVSGLNVPWNLRIIDQATNSRKGNWFLQV